MDEIEQVLVDEARDRGVSFATLAVELGDRLARPAESTDTLWLRLEIVGGVARVFAETAGQPPSASLEIREEALGAGLLHPVPEPGGLLERLLVTAARRLHAGCEVSAGRAPSGELELVLALHVVEDGVPCDRPDRIARSDARTQTLTDDLAAGDVLGLVLDPRGAAVVALRAVLAFVGRHHPNRV